MGLKQGLNITIKNYFLTDTKNLLVNKKIEEFLCLQKYKSNPMNSLNTRYFYLRESILKYKPIKLSILISSLFFFFFHLFFIFYNRLSILTWQLLIFKKQKYFLKPIVEFSSKILIVFLPCWRCVFSQVLYIKEVKWSFRHYFGRKVYLNP